MMFSGFCITGTKNGEGLIMPIFGKGGKGKQGNYRTVFLTSGKLLEQNIKQSFL